MKHYRHPKIRYVPEEGKVYFFPTEMFVNIGKVPYPPLLTALLVNERYRLLGWGSSLVQLAARIAGSEGANFLVCPGKISFDYTIEASLKGVSLFERALGAEKEYLSDGSWQLPIKKTFPFDYFKHKASDFLGQMSRFFKSIPSKLIFVSLHLGETVQQKEFIETLTATYPRAEVERVQGDSL